MSVIGKLSSMISRLRGKSEGSTGSIAGGRRSPEETLFGFIAEFDKAMVLHKDVRYFGSVRDDLIDLTVKYSQLNNLEMSIGGYDSDDRSLYEVPEVRRWIKIIQTRWPDWLFWLTPGSLWFCMLCLNPGMHERLSDGRLQIALDTDQLTDQFAKSQMAGLEVLVEAGMAEEHLDRASKQALQNFIQMFERKKLGDYVVVHPEHGSVITYRSET